MRKKDSTDKLDKALRAIGEASAEVKMADIDKKLMCDICEKIGEAYKIVYKMREEEAK